MTTCHYCQQQNLPGVARCTRCYSGLPTAQHVEITTNLHLDLHVSRFTEGSSGPILDPYLELLECNLREARLITDLLQQEGILCRAEKTDGLQLKDPLEDSVALSYHKGLILKVKAGEYSKARAVLAWEIQQEIEEGLQTDLGTDSSDEFLCPSCKAPLSEDTGSCLDCGSSIPTTGEITPEPYQCWVCASSLNLPDRICPSCGSRLDN